MSIGLSLLTEIFLTSMEFTGISTPNIILWDVFIDIRTFCPKLIAGLTNISY